MASKNTGYHHISFSRSWKLNTDTIYELGQCDAFVEALSSVPIDPQDHKELLHVSLVKGAKATTAIEGNTLSEEDISRIAEGEKLSPSLKYQENEVKNILDAFNQILHETTVENRAQRITCGMIKQFHQMVGKDLGNVFQAIPGKFRMGEVHVGGIYIPPKHDKVPELIDKFCEWLYKEFQFEKGQTFSESIIHAIVSHVYIAWIHPFGDGNGRTARLLEFYIMMRAGNPDFASHLLSNFYNETRNEYYHYLDQSRKTGDLTEFIAYAVKGYKDGLKNLLELISGSLFHAAWKNYIYGIFKNKKSSGNLGVVLKRCRDLVIEFPPDREYTIDEIKLLNVDIASTYKVLSPKTLERDLAKLMQFDLISKSKDKYSLRIDLLLSQYMAVRAPIHKTVS